MTPLVPLGRRWRQARDRAALEHRALAERALREGAAEALGDAGAVLEAEGDALLLRPARSGPPPVSVVPRYETWSVDVGGDDPTVELWEDDPGQRAARLRSVVAAVVAGAYTRTVEPYGRGGHLVTLRFQPPAGEPVVVREHHGRPAEEPLGERTAPAY